MKEYKPLLTLNDERTNDVYACKSLGSVSSKVRRTASQLSRSIIAKLVEEDCLKKSMNSEGLTLKQTNNEGSRLVKSKVCKY